MGDKLNLKPALSMRKDKHLSDSDRGDDTSATDTQAKTKDIDIHNKIERPCCDCIVSSDNTESSCESYDDKSKSEAQSISGSEDCEECRSISTSKGRGAESLLMLDNNLKHDDPCILKVEDVLQLHTILRIMLLLALFRVSPTSCSQDKKLSSGSLVKGWPKKHTKARSSQTSKPVNIKLRQNMSVREIFSCSLKLSGKRQRRKKLNDLLGSFDTFHYLEPAPVIAAVFPVIRQDPKQGPGSQGQREQGKEPPAQPPSEGQKWPPDSLYGLPWSTFRQELHRLGTFMSLPANSPVFAVRLAQAGFLRFPDGAIICFFCGLQRDEWNHGDSPIDIHRRLRGDCPVVTGEGSENQPVVELSEERLQELMELWSLSGPPLLPGRQPDQRQRAVEVADAVGMVSQPTQITSRAANPSAFSRGRGPIGSRLTADLAADGHPSAPAPGGQGAQASAPPDRRASPSAAAANPSGPGASSISAPAAVDVNGQRDQQPPRMGLLGGDAASADPPAPRGPIFDGTAQPEPPRAPADNASTEGSEPRAGQQVVTYQQLGIVTEAPKRPDMAMINSRVGSFRSWPATASHTPLQLAEAGFYYAGYADCGRCFFCGGGLKNWEPVDNPWVEHARWFPKCAYIRQCQGQDFIDVVQELNDDRCPISLNRVTEEINRRRADGERIQEPVVDPAVSSVMELGVRQADVDAAVQRVQREGHLVTADRLFDSLLAEGLLAAGGSSSIADSEVGQVDELVTENSEIRQQRMCKICLDKESCIVFLPCGHLVCCAECSPALKHCPMCRQRVKGRVRAFPA